MGKPAGQGQVSQALQILGGPRKEGNCGLFRPAALPLRAPSAHHNGAPHLPWRHPRCGQRGAARGRCNCRSAARSCRTPQDSPPSGRASGERTRKHAGIAQGCKGEGKSMRPSCPVPLTSPQGWKLNQSQPTVCLHAPAHSLLEGTAGMGARGSPEKRALGAKSVRLLLGSPCKKVSLERRPPTSRRSGVAADARCASRSSAPTTACARGARCVSQCMI